MVPVEAMRGKPIETTLTIPLWHGGELFVMGMDRPERIEGPPLDHIVLDEYANMKATAWPAHVRPALSTKGRPGSADFTGVPEGRNHFFDLAQLAKALKADPSSDWDHHHWHSREILAASEIEAAMRDLDERTFDQEYGGEFVLFSGRAYYGFGEYSTAPLRHLYDPTKVLCVSFDFNVSPGVACISQEVELPVSNTDDDNIGTAVIGEVYIPDNSTTPAVCRKVLEDWGDHVGPVQCYGDATGGARGTAQTEGSDWELIRQILRFGDGDGLAGFGVDRCTFHVKPSNPSERARVNAVNSRLRSSSGDVRLMVDPVHAPHVVLDFEGVITLEGGSGEINKKATPSLSHITDGLGYYVDYRHPIHSRAAGVIEVVF